MWSQTVPIRSKSPTLSFCLLCAVRDLLSELEFSQVWGNSVQKYFYKKYNKSSSVLATPCSFSDTRVEALKRQNGQNDEIVQFSQISHNEINCSILRYLGPTIWFRTWIFIIVFGSCPVRTDAHNWFSVHCGSSATATVISSEQDNGTVVDLCCMIGLKPW